MFQYVCSNIVLAVHYHSTSVVVFRPSISTTTEKHIDMFVVCKQFTMDQVPHCRSNIQGSSYSCKVFLDALAG